MIWTKNLCVNIDLDTGWLVACVCLALIPKHHNLFHKLGEKGYSILLTATLNTQHTISVINCSLPSPSGSADTNIFPVRADSTLASLQEVFPLPDSNKLQMKT